MGPRRAQRDADPDLALAPADHVAHKAVEAHQGQAQGEPGGGRGEAGVHPRLAGRGAPQLGEGRGLGDGTRGIELPGAPAQQGDFVRRAAPRADRHVGAPLRALPVRHVDRRRRRKTHVAARRVPHDGDDAAGTLLARQAQRPPHRVARREVEGGQGLADHRHRGARDRVRPTEHAPRTHRDAEGLEVVAGDRVDSRLDGGLRSHPPRAGEPHLHPTRNVSRAAGRGARGGDEALGAQAVEEPVHRGVGAIGVVLPGAGERHPQARAAGRVEPLVDPLGVPGAPDQQAAPDDQHRRNRHLRDDEPAHRGGPAGRGVGAGHRREAGQAAKDPPDGRDCEGASGHRGDGQPDAQHAQVRHEVELIGHGQGQQRRERARPGDERGRAEAAGRHEHGDLHAEPPHQVGPRGPQGATDGQLVPPLRRSGQQQRRQVRARHREGGRRHEAENAQKAGDLVPVLGPQPQVARGESAHAPRRPRLRVVDALAAVPGEGLVHGVDARLNRLQGGAGGEAAEGLEHREGTAVQDVASREVVVGHHRRDPERALERRPHRAPEAGRGHPDDVVHVLVQAHRPAHDLRIRREPAAPQEVREHDEAVSPRDHVVRGADEPPEGRPDTEHGEEGAGHHLPFMTLRKRPAGHGHEDPAERGEVDGALERRPELGVVRVRQRRILGAARHVQRHELAAVAEVERTQERPVQQTEDEGRAGHAEGERQHAGRGPPGLAGEGAAGETQVLTEVAEPVAPPFPGLRASHGRGLYRGASLAVAGPPGTGIQLHRRALALTHGPQPPIRVPRQDAAATHADSGVGGSRSARLDRFALVEWASRTDSPGSQAPR